MVMPMRRRLQGGVVPHDLLIGRFGRMVIAISVIAALAVALIPAAHAAARKEVRVVRGAEGRVLGSTGEDTRSPARRTAAAESVEGRFATFVIDLDDFPEDARKAMRYALRSVGKVVMSRIPIVVEAHWEPLEGDTLGLGSHYAHLLDGGIAGDGTWFPDALANDLLNEDMDPSMYEIRIRLNSDFPDWYFGTDGKGSAGQVDFVNTAVHELLHGLGWYTELEVVNEEGRWGSRGSVPKTDPVRFDLFVENGDGAVLVLDFDNPSEQLAEQIRSQNLFFGGPTATASNGGIAPALYAPSVYTPSSVAHLDRIFDDTPDGTITPFDNPSHALGPVIRGVLADLAYLIAHERNVSLGDQKHLKFKGKVAVPLGYPGCRSDIKVLIQRLKKGRWVKVASEKTEANGDFKVQAPDRAGRYRAKITRQNKGPLKVNICLPATSATVVHRH